MFGHHALAQEARVSLALHEVSVDEVLNTIENQSNYYFLANQKLVDLNRKVSIQADNQSIPEVLTALFAGTGVTHMISDKIIILSTQDLPGVGGGAQNFTEPRSSRQDAVSGQVRDEEGQSLPGVTIAIKGTERGTSTDVNGFYSLPDVSPDDVLVFSFIGMESLEIPVDSRSVIDVTMAYEIISLEEFVFIGYGTIRRGDLTGALTAVQGERISERHAPILSQSLQGAIPGLMVTRTNNQPGASATVRVRGITTIGDSSPLVLVDGIPVDDINDVNPANVEDITVLKDAASASIYGARAAAGVILITTKRPDSDQLSLTYTHNVGFEQPTRLPAFADAVGYMNMVNELRWNDLRNEPGMHFPQYSRGVVENYDELHESNPDLYPITDWAGMLLSDRAMRSSHSLSINAGTNMLKTRFSINYEDVDGLYLYNRFRRISMRMNNDIQITDFLKSSVDVYYARAVNNNPSVTQGQVMHSAFSSAPVYAAKWSNGYVGAGKDGNNMYAQLLHGGFADAWDNTLSGRVSLTLTPLEDLTLTAVVAPEIKFNKRKAFSRRVQYTAWDDPTLVVGVTDWGRSTNIQETRIDLHNLTTQLVGNYARSFGDHNITSMVGFESFYFFREIMRSSSDNLTLDSYPYLDLRNPNYLSSMGSALENAYESFFGRLVYSFRSKYLFQANLRMDGSSRFHSDYRWGTFPSFSAGWVVSEESFMNNILSNTFLRLRASWGLLGNERIGYYPYQATINFTNAAFYRGTNIIADQTAAQHAYAIQNISWETTEVLNVGFDVTTLRDRLSIAFDVYNKETKDMLLALEIPDFMGYDNPQQNTGSMYTKGWELEFSWRDQIGDFRYQVSANVSDSRSVMGDLGGIQFLGNKVKIEGSEFDEWYGYLSDGLFQNADEIDLAALPHDNIMPGDVRFVDVSGPGGEPDGVISPDYDKVLLGGSLPRYLFGANINLQYKQFDFSMTVQGVGKQNAVWTNNMRQPYQSAWRNMPMTIDGQYWSVYNSEEENLAARFPRLTWNNASNNYAMSDFWLFDGSYLRLKNIVVGYTLPQRLTGRLAMQKSRIYVSVSDLFSLDHYPEGWDPEVANTGYPITTSVILGVSVTF